MINYMKAENLKFKRTFSRKMIIFVPLLNIGFSFLMNNQFFVSGTFNWWSIIFMPVMIALLCSLSHQKEKKPLIILAPIPCLLIWGDYGILRLSLLWFIRYYLKLYF